MSEKEVTSTEQVQTSEAAIDPTRDPRLDLLAKKPDQMEKLIALCFIVGIACFVAMMVFYVRGSSTQVEGALMAAGFGGLGVGMVAWGKYLMPKGPFEEERHQIGSTEEDRKAFADAFIGRGTIAVKRRSFLGKLLGLATAIFGIFSLGPLLDSLGPNPGNALDSTAWKKGSKVVTEHGRAIKVDDLEVGGFMTVFPEGNVGSYDGQTLLIRAGTSDIVTMPGRESWGPQGYLAYSKVCTHAGCPISLYQQETEQLLCPCHQSLFNVLQAAEPVFGPAPRPLPQLPLAIDKNGYIIAQAGYNEPIGPGYWNF